jgi:hypothetical protein
MHRSSSIINAEYMHSSSSILKFNRFYKKKMHGMVQMIILTGMQIELMQKLKH